MAYRTTPCHQGVTSANSPRRPRHHVYAIGYDLNGSGTDYEQCHPATGPIGPGVNLEQPPITSFEAMGGVQGVPGIASSFDTFYNKPNPGQLSDIFRNIASDIFRSAQLIDDSLRPSSTGLLETKPAGVLHARFGQREKPPFIGICRCFHASLNRVIVVLKSLDRGSPALAISPFAQHALFRFIHVQLRTDRWKGVKLT